MDVCRGVQGLKTGMYYLRTRAAADAIKFTVDQNRLRAGKRGAATNSHAMKLQRLEVCRIPALRGGWMNRRHECAVDAACLICCKLTVTLSSQKLKYPTVLNV